MWNGKDIRSPRHRGNRRVPFQTMAMFLINTRHVISYDPKLTDPRDCFFLIANGWFGRTGLVFPRPFRPIWKRVWPPGGYKPTHSQLSFRVPTLRNSTISLFPSTILNIMPPARTFNNRSFYPFPIDYSSETFAPLVCSDRQISHVIYLLRGQPTMIARFHHYLTTCATIFALEHTLQDLQNSREHVFTEFITPNVVHCLQPFLIQTRVDHIFPLLPLSLPTLTINTFKRQFPRWQNPRLPFPPPTEPTTHSRLFVFPIPSTTTHPSSLRLLVQPRL